MSPLKTELLGKFQVPAIDMFDPKNSNMINPRKYNPYPPVVHSRLFQNTIPKVVDVPERTVGIYRITSLNEDTDITLDDIFSWVEGGVILSPAHIIPLAYAIIEDEHQKAKEKSKTPADYRVPWNKGTQHLLFETFLVDNDGNLSFTWVEFNWWGDIVSDEGTFGLGISPCDAGLSNEFMLAVYIKNDDASAQDSRPNASDSLNN